MHRKFITEFSLSFIHFNDSFSYFFYLARPIKLIHDDFTAQIRIETEQ